MQWDWVVWPFAVLFGLLSIAGLVLWIWALVDCVKVPDDSMYQSGNKLIWVLILVFLNWIGAVLYVLIGRPASGATGRGQRPSPSGGAGPDAGAPSSGGPLPPPPAGSV
jgi:hypothetical protein